MSVSMRHHSSQLFSYHLEVTLLRILVSQDPVVWQLPAESIWDDNDNALR